MEINDAGDIKITGKFDTECPRMKRHPTNIHDGYGYSVVCTECGCEAGQMEIEDDEDDYDAAVVHNSVKDLVRMQVIKTLSPFNSVAEDEVIAKAIANKVLGDLVNDPNARRAILTCMALERDATERL